MKILILGLSPTAKYVAREAASYGITCYGIDTNKGAAYYSRYFSKTTVRTTVEAQCAWIAAEFSESEQPVYVCPTSDEWIAFIEAQSLFRNPVFRVNSVYLDGSYQQLADKKALQVLSGKYEIPYPQSRIVVAGAQLPDFAGMDFPFFCKPTNRAGLAAIMQGRKGWLVANKSELESVLSQDMLQGIELIVQEVIEGPESNIFVLGTVGNPTVAESIPAWVGQKARQYPVGFGSGSLVIESPNSAIEEIAKILLEKTGYVGYFALETKYCTKRKQTYIIEVNTRPGLWFGVTTPAGSQFVLHWLNTFAENKMDISVPVKGQPVIWQYWYKDQVARLLNRAGQVNLPKGYQRTYAVWDARDMQPFIFDLWNGLRKLIRRKLRA